jgi:hypothetical protein
MNQQFGSPQQGPMPQGGPYEAPPQMPGNVPPGGQQFNYQAGPGMEEPSGGGGKSWILIIILLIILIIGGVLFASWQGYIHIGFLDNLFGNKTSETPVETPTTEPTPTVSNDTIRKSDLSQIKLALKQYYQANQAYPISTKSPDKTSDSDSALKVLVPNYITTLPADPLSPTNYYAYKSDGKIFELTCVLEDQIDPAGMMVGTFFIYRVTDSSVEAPVSSSGTTSGTTGTSTTGSSTSTTGTTSGTIVPSTPFNASVTTE